MITIDLSLLLGGSADQKITGITIAGEDLLVARQEKWALVMDPDGRQRLEQMLDAAPRPQTSSSGRTGSTRKMLPSSCCLLAFAMR